MEYKILPKMNNNNASSSILYQNPKFCSECKGSSATYIKKRHQSGCDTCSIALCKTGSQTDQKSSANTNKIRKSAFYSEYCNENRHLETKCYQYKTILQRVRSLLEEIKAIKKNETVGICNFCKRYNSMSNCKRCEIMAKQLGLKTINNEEIRERRFNLWLSKVKEFLYTILEREVCQHRLYHKDAVETDELTNLLNQLKIPLDIKKPYICHFSCMDTIEKLTESKDILEEVLSKFRTVKGELPSCTLGALPCPEVCKQFIKRKTEKQSSKIDNVQNGMTTDNVLTEVDVNLPLIEKPTLIDSETKDSTKIQTIKTHRKPKNKNYVSNTGGVRSTSQAKTEKSKIKKEKNVKASPTSEDALMKMLMKSYQTKKEKSPKPPKKEKVPTIPNIAELPVPTRKTPKKLIEDDIISESIIECDLPNVEHKEMIKALEIVPYECVLVSEKDSVVPMIYKVKVDFTDEESNVSTKSSVSQLSVSVKPKKKPEYGDLVKSGENVVKYMLSNRDFIGKGWTILPTTKMMRRMNIYKMVQVSPQSNWFKKYQHKGVVLYDTGEKFADIDETGHGRWYYKNGRLALDYYGLQEPRSGFRYVVYSSGESDEFGRKSAVTVLASFDNQGNGIVYDSHGNERLKYNQSEGIVIDEKIGPPGRWKWHTLNDPPVLIPVFIDTHVDKDKCFQDLNFRDDKSESSSKHTKEPDIDMLAIELENFMKEKANKLSQKFKPFQIKMKALKINEKISLKVLDQSNIYLMFRDGQVSVKLNLGMLLISDEIVDTDTAEVAQVATPYDRWPPRSQSIADMQNLIEKTKNRRKTSAM